jgi:ribosomal protein S18 acetylase RimI-like enzyme
MILSKATYADVDQLTRLLGVLFEQEAEFSPYPESHKKALQKIISDNDIGVILIARQNDKIIAMVNLLFTMSTALGARVAVLEDMIVDPALRGEGVGSKLIDYAICEAKDSGCKRITLLTDGDNTRAQDFYRRKGFQKSLMIPFRLLL